MKLGITDSFIFLLGLYSKRFQPHVYRHALRQRVGHHLPLVPLPLEVLGPHSKSSKTREKLGSEYMIFWARGCWAKCGKPRYSNSSPPWGMEYRDGTLYLDALCLCLVLRLLDRLSKFLASTNVHKLHASMRWSGAGLTTHIWICDDR